MFKILGAFSRALHDKSTDGKDLVSQASGREEAASDFSFLLTNLALSSVLQKWGLYLTEEN